MSALEYEKQCDTSNPKKCVQTLREGELAPFDGDLLTPEMSVDLGQKAFWCDERLQLKLDVATEKLRIDLKAARDILANNDAFHKKEIHLLTERLKEAHRTPFYKEPIFVASVSVVLTILAVYGASQLFNHN